VRSVSTGEVPAELQSRTVFFVCATAGWKGGPVPALPRWALALQSGPTSREARSVQDPRPFARRRMAGEQEGGVRC